MPLVLLTADRPPELRDRGAPQTIDQAGIFGRQPSGTVEAAAVRRGPGDRGARPFDRRPGGGDGRGGPRRRRAAERAVPGAADPGDSALVPSSPADESAGGHDAVHVCIAGRPVLDEEAVAELAALLGRTPAGPHRRGPGRRPGAARRARRARPRRPASRSSPTVVRPRTGPHDRSRVVSRADQLARPGRVARCPPAGPRHPDSGRCRRRSPSSSCWSGCGPALIVIDGDGGWREPALMPTTFVHADAAA